MEKSDAKKKRFRHKAATVKKDAPKAEFDPDAMYSGSGGGGERPTSPIGFFKRVMSYFSSKKKKEGERIASPIGSPKGTATSPLGSPIRKASMFSFLGSGNGSPVP